MPLDLNPNPLKGQGVYGLVPGTIGMPTPGADLNTALGGGLSDLNKGLLGTISAWNAGQLSPGTRNALQATAATLGANMGMPGGISGGGAGSPLNPFSTNNLYGNIAGFAEGQQAKALQAYNSLIPTVSNTQTVSPALQSQLAETNALSLAAPSPSAAGSHAEQLFQKYLNSLRGPGGGSGGITRGGIGGGGSTDLLGFPTGGAPTGDLYGGGTGAPGTTTRVPTLAGGVIPGSVPYGGGPDYGGEMSTTFGAPGDYGGEIGRGFGPAGGYNPSILGGTQNNDFGNEMGAGVGYPSWLRGYPGLQIPGTPSPYDAGGELNI